jgi:uncharacterized protein
MPSSEQPTVRPPPWWRHGHLWLVVAGPAVVVVASMATAVIAARGADTVVDDSALRKGVAISKQAVAERAHLPALQARNHAATPTASDR